MDDLFFLHNESIENRKKTLTVYHKYTIIFFIVYHKYTFIVYHKYTIKLVKCKETSKIPTEFSCSARLIMYADIFMSVCLLVFVP